MHPTEVFSVNVFSQENIGIFLLCILKVDYLYGMLLMGAL